MDYFQDLMETFQKLASDTGVHTDPLETRQPPPSGRARRMISFRTYRGDESGRLHCIVITAVELD